MFFCIIIDNVGIVFMFVLFICWDRVRTASSDVIQALVHAGANPNQKNALNPLMTPLVLVLLRGSSTTDLGNRLMQTSPNSPAVDGLGNWMGRIDNHSSPLSIVDGPRNNPTTTNCGGDWDSPDNMHKSSVATATTTGKPGHRTWIRAAETLLRVGKFLLFFLLSFV